jgi:hypothetical protein
MGELPEELVVQETGSEEEYKESRLDRQTG